jgi:hypothetical protein
MEVRLPRPGISLDIPKELKSNLLEKPGVNPVRCCADRQHVALPEHSKTDGISGLRQETPRLKPQNPISLTSILKW